MSLQKLRGLRRAFSASFAISSLAMYFLWGHIALFTGSLLGAAILGSLVGTVCFWWLEIIEKERLAYEEWLRKQRAKEERSERFWNFVKNPFSRGSASGFDRGDPKPNSGFKPNTQPPPRAEPAQDGRSDPGLHQRAAEQLLWSLLGELLRHATRKSAPPGGTTNGAGRQSGANHRGPHYDPFEEMFGFGGSSGDPFGFGRGPGFGANPNQRRGPFGGNQGAGYGGYGGFPPPPPPGPRKDYYAILGVTRTASDDEIKKAFRKGAMRCHPDRFPGDKAKEAEFKELNEAHQVLSDPQKRAAFDRFGYV